MSQEIRFNAEVYGHFYFIFKNIEKTLFLMLDGITAKSRHKNGQLPHQTLADICFIKTGNKNPTCIEGKTVKNNRRVSLSKNQLEGWNSNEKNPFKPKHWIAVSNDYSKYFYWAMEDMQEGIDEAYNKKTKRTFIQINTKWPTLKVFDNIEMLSKHLDKVTQE